MDQIAEPGVGQKMPHRIQSPSAVAQSFRDDGSGAMGSDVQVLHREREKAIAVISAFLASMVFSAHVFVRVGRFELKDATVYLLTLGLGLLSLLGWRRMKRATRALGCLQRSDDEKA